MLFQTLSLATLLAAIPSTLALPEVTIKALPADCSSYPGYDADSQIAGPWILNMVNSDNPDLENFGNSVVYSLSVSQNGPSMRWGYVHTPCNTFEIRF
jgi:hypothetical protein